MGPILRVDNLTKVYGDFTAVDHVSFEIGEGEIVGFLGPNGAGKTTTIHMLLSILEPSEGRIEIFGKNIAKNRERILEKVNFAAPYATLPYNLTVYENLVVFSLLYGVRDRKRKIDSLLQEFDLGQLRNRRTGALSSGEQTRLGLAKAFFNDPRLLLLDEPITSLDPPVARRLRATICQKIKAVQGAVLWTSHNMREIETVCTRIIFLTGGRIVEDDSLDNIRRKYNHNDLEDIFVLLST